MFGIPMEAISMLGSTILGGLMTMWGQSAKDKQDQFKMLLQQNKQIEDSIQSARENKDPFAAWTRRIIALTMIFGSLAIIFAAPLMETVTNVPIERQEGFKFLFFDFTRTVTEYVQLTGFVVPEYLPIVVLNIVGFYFGSAAMQRK
jgi:hypothetical protein